MIEPHGANEMHFVVMNNTFSPTVEIHERYDLKGSTVGRYASAQERDSESVILKDLDIKRKITVGKDMKKLLMEQLEKDTKLLADNNLMDYSFLIGVHLQSYTSETELKTEVPVVVPEDPQKLIVRISQFKKEEGGMVSFTGHELYFLTIIDIFTVWNVKKRVEHSMKSLVYESNAISAIHPEKYRERFLSFLSQRFE